MVFNMGLSHLGSEASNSNNNDNENIISYNNYMIHGLTKQIFQSQIIYIGLLGISVPKWANPVKYVTKGVTSLSG